MKQINIIGNILGTSGFEVHTRNLANALDKLTKVRLSCQLMPNWERMVNDRELEMIKRKPEEDEINLIITSPIYWKINCGKRNFAYLVWEGDRVPDDFIEYCLNPDIAKIIVPSRHTYEALINTAKELEVINLEAKVHIVHHGVNLDLFYQKEKPKKLTFLVNKGWRHNQDRGGTQYAVKAYMEEFTDKDNIEMILKINPAYGIPNIQQLIEQITDKRTDLPKLTIDANSYKYEELVHLYNKANVLIAPSRAEAFGLHMIEAMACGLPVLTGSFGGQTDFVNNENGWLINGKLEEVKWEIQYEGIKWITPDINEIKQKMREMYEKSEIIDSKAVSARNTAIQYQWMDTAKKIIELGGN